MRKVAIYGLDGFPYEFTYEELIPVLAEWLFAQIMFFFSDFCPKFNAIVILADEYLGNKTQTSSNWKHSCNTESLLWDLNEVENQNL